MIREELESRDDLQRELAELRRQVRALQATVSEYRRRESALRVHDRYIAAMRQIGEAIAQSFEPDAILRNIVESVRAIFAADRAWLYYPCDPDARISTVPVEATVPEYPGAFAKGEVIPNDLNHAEVYRHALASDKPIVHAPMVKFLAFEIERYSVRSQMMIAIRPPYGKPWLLGLHQCAYLRIWSEEEHRLFQAIAERLADALGAAHLRRELRRSEERLRLALDGANHGLWDWNLGDCTVYRSPHWHALLGIEPEAQPPVQAWEAQLHPDDRAAARGAWDDFLAGRAAHYENEYRVQTREGNWLWVLDRGEAVRRDAMGKPLRAVGTLTDITGHKQVEQALRLSEERIRTALMAAPVVVFNCDRDLRYTWLHNARLGNRSERLLGKRLPDLILHPQEAAAAEALMRRVLESGTGFHQEVSIHYGEEEHVFDLAVEPLRDAQGWVVGLTGAAIEITEHVRMREQLRAQADQLAEEDRRKSEFLAVLAHELRNPLAPIRNCVEVLKRQREPLPPALQWAVDVIDRQATQLTRLVDDLLDVTRISLGKILLRKAPVDVAEIVSRAVETVQPLIEARRLRLAMSLPAKPLQLEADAARITQVVANLLHNAAKYTLPGGHVELSVRREGHEAVFRVRDTGVGIAPEALPRVFDTFMQIGTERDRTHGGLGLGLALVRHLVELHGGTVHAESAGLEQGSEFSVRLPLS